MPKRRPTNIPITGLVIPYSFFPYVLASPWAFPWPRHRCELLGEDWHRPENIVSNGPFTLAEFDDEHALLTANPYWNGPRGNVREIEIPFIETVHLEHPSPRNPLEVKGVGEGGAISPPAALANAIEDALAPFGVRITEGPVTPARIVALVKPSLRA